MSDAKDIFKLYIESKQEPQMRMDAEGYKRWTLNNKFHREDGPAVESPDGSKAWFVNGRLHRLDGPAFVQADEAVGWYVNGKEYTDMEAWARAALEFEQKQLSQDNIDAKMSQVMQQDLFA